MYGRQFFTLYMQFMRYDLLSTVLMNNHDLSDEDITPNLGTKCSREDTNATISTLT